MKKEQTYSERMEAFRLNPTHGVDVTRWEHCETLAAAPMANAEMVNGKFEITGYLVHSNTNHAGGFFGTHVTVSVKNNDGVYVGYTIRWAHTLTNFETFKDGLYTFTATSRYDHESGHVVPAFLIGPAV